MMEVESRVIGLGDYFKLFEAVKFGGFVNTGKYGVLFEPGKPHSGTATISIVLNGRVIEERVLFNMVSKREKKVKEVKPKEVLAEATMVGETDLFEL